MKANVTTCNSVIKNGECVGGYHELHEIHYLSGMEHLIATIDSIIKNNLLYGCEDTILEYVIVACDDNNAVKYISEHRKDIFHYPNVKVRIDLLTTLSIVLTCPECGNSTWCRHEDEDATGFVCLACGKYCETEEMGAVVREVTK